MYALVKSLLYWYVMYISFSVLITMTMAVLNIHFGLSKLYRRILLWMFNFGREKVDNKTKTSEVDVSVGDEDIDTPTSAETSTNGIIERISDRGRIWEFLENPKPVSVDSSKCKTLGILLDDGLDWIKCGIESIICDEVTDKFAAAELASWNLLTRTDRGYFFVSWRLSFLWLLGFLFRYIFLVPVRICLLLNGVIFLLASSAVIGNLPIAMALKKRLSSACSCAAFRIITRFCQASITFHDTQNRAGNGSICVANHTSPFDVVALSSVLSYAFVGQKEYGPGGFIQSMLNKSQDHIWFDRQERHDRELVTKKLRAHVQDKTKSPILIFPEGVCSNNTSVLLFRKGSFEVCGTIYPIAIKYDNRFCDVFFGQDTMLPHAWSLLTSWCINCDVYYLEPEQRGPDESAIDFAHRVQVAISMAGRFIDVPWDGYTKFGIKEDVIQKAKNLYSKKLLSMVQPEQTKSR